AGLVTSEAGGSAAFSVRLTSQPQADVAIALSSDRPAEGTASPATLTFDAGNWNLPQTVTVHGADDFVVDGDQPYTIVLNAASSADPRYADMDPADVALLNADNDVVGVAFDRTSGLATTEAGGSASVAVHLTSMPSAAVTFDLSSNNTAEGNVEPATLVFSLANWSVPQTITVTGVDDAVADGDQLYAIVLAAAQSADAHYGGMDAADVGAKNLDNDAAGIRVEPVSGLVTTEAGGAASFGVTLASQPTADVSIAVASSKPAEGVASPASLTFTPADWNVAQTVTVTGRDDQMQDGDVAYQVILAAAASADPIYQGMDVADVSLSNTDDDVAGISVSASSITTTEAGGNASFTVRLTSQPTADVVIPVASSNLAEGTVSAASLTFTAADWNVPQTATITGVDDHVQDGDIAYGIVLAPASSADPHYAGMDPADVAASNSDDDSAGIAVSPLSGLATSEAGAQASF